jgi:hypothetical protein
LQYYLVTLFSILTQAEKARLDREAEEEEKRHLEAERAAREPRHQDLNLEVLAAGLEESELSKWKILRDTLAKKYLRHTSDSTPAADLGPDEQKTEMDRAREELVEELEKLVVTSRAKVCKVCWCCPSTQGPPLTASRQLGTNLLHCIPPYCREHTFSSLCESSNAFQTKDLVLFGDKNGSLGIWDARGVLDEHEEEKQPHDTAEDGQYWRFQVRVRPWCKVATR